MLTEKEPKHTDRINVPSYARVLAQILKQIVQMLPREDSSGASQTGSSQASHEPSLPKSQMLVAHRHKGRKRDPALENCVSILCLTGVHRPGPEGKK